MKNRLKGALNKSPSRACIRLLALLGGCALWYSNASAAILPDEIQQAIEQQNQAYVQLPGYTPVELDATFWDDYYQTLEAQLKKAGLSKQPASASIPDSTMAPIERALRVLETREGTLPRVRYHIEYRLVNLPEHDYWEPRAHIQITRYNLGPTIRREAVASHGPENVASPEEFGIGPHVRWRLVVAPVQNLASDIWTATRQVLDADEAEAADCLGTPCLSTGLIEGPASGWHELNTPPSFAPAPENNLSDLAAATGIVAGAALGSSNLGYGEAVEARDRAAPQLVLLASDGIGPDPVLNVLAHQPIVMDDAVEQIWLRRVELPPSVYWSQLPIYRPGRN